MKQLAPIHESAPDLLERMDRCLEKATTLAEVMRVRNVAQTAQQYYRAADQSRELLIEAERLKLQAEYKAGEILRLTKERGERATGYAPLKKVESSRSTPLPTLPELAITRDQSSLWQRVAAVPKKIFNEYISRQAKGLMEITTQGLLRTAKEAEREKTRQNNAALVEQVGEIPDEQFSTIVLDPPWDWADEGDQDQLGRALPTYQTKSFDELKSLDVQECAMDDAHLYLWITNRSLPKGFALIEAWGFRYVTALTWVKPSFGMGNYFRGSTEHVLFGVRGSLPLLRRDVATHFLAPRGEGGHSSKPEAFYRLVESCSPGPWLEMFARQKRQGWKSWGAELEA